jgi:hypothetical protein
VGQKVIFTNLGSSTPGSYKKSVCDINIVTNEDVTTNEFTRTISGGTATYTVVTAGDYIFTIVTSGASVQIQ